MGGRKGEQAADTAGERKHMWDLTEKHFKVAVKSMFKEQKETIIREVNTGMMTISY